MKARASGGVREKRIIRGCSGFNALLSVVACRFSVRFNHISASALTGRQSLREIILLECKSYADGKIEKNRRRATCSLRRQLVLAHDHNGK